MEENTIFCIVGTGRCGSSLLSAILAGAGADFGLKAKNNWDPVKGALEHSSVHAAYKYLHRIQLLKTSVLPRSLFGYGYFHRKLREELERLRDISYVKSAKLVYLIHYLGKYGFRPKLIVSYRMFDDVLMSYYRKFGVDFSTMEKRFCNTYRTAFMGLKAFGGVVIDYDELCSSDSRSSFSAIEGLTGLDRERLFLSKNRILKTRKPTAGRDLMSTRRVRHVENLMAEAKNKVF